VNEIATFAELKAKVNLGKAVADIKRALTNFPVMRLLSSWARACTHHVLL
jgi:hypothetical protein